jgi:NADPH:quinone reductase-like Zn-dependent oxidoreductase
MEMAAPAANESTALVRIMAASINPSDVKNVAGGHEADDFAAHSRPRFRRRRRGRSGEMDRS